MNVLVDERSVALKAARRENRRLPRNLAEPHVTRRTHQRVGKTPWIEALADGARIPSLVRDDGRAQRLEPRDPVVEPFPHDALQALVAGRTLGAEVLPVAETPDHAARQQHRTAGARPLLVHHRCCPELACTHGRAEAGHARAGDT